MSLKVRLKSGERVIVGGAVIQNSNAACELLIENKVPILRQKDILAEEDASSPCRRIYYVIQLMYIDGQGITTYHKIYWKLVRELLDAAPSTLPLIDEISENILINNFYKALKLTQKLIQYEQEIISRAEKSSTSL